MSVETVHKNNTSKTTSIPTKGGAEGSTSPFLLNLPPLNADLVDEGFLMGTNSSHGLDVDIILDLGVGPLRSHPHRAAMTSGTFSEDELYFVIECWNSGGGESSNQPSTSLLRFKDGAGMICEGGNYTHLFAAGYNCRVSGNDGEEDEGTEALAAIGFRLFIDQMTSLIFKLEEKRRKSSKGSTVIDPSGSLVVSASTGLQHNLRLVSTLVSDCHIPHVLFVPINVDGVDADILDRTVFCLTQYLLCTGISAVSEIHQLLFGKSMTILDAKSREFLRSANNAMVFCKKLGIPLCVLFDAKHGDRFIIHVCFTASNRTIAMHQLPESTICKGVELIKTIKRFLAVYLGKSKDSDRTAADIPAGSSDRNIHAVVKVSGGGGGAKTASTPLELHTSSSGNSNQSSVVVKVIVLEQSISQLSSKQGGGKDHKKIVGQQQRKDKRQLVIKATQRLESTLYAGTKVTSKAGELQGTSIMGDDANVLCLVCDLPLISIRDVSSHLLRAPPTSKVASGLQQSTSSSASDRVFPGEWDNSPNRRALRVLWDALIQVHRIDSSSTLTSGTTAKRPLLIYSISDDTFDLQL